MATRESVILDHINHRREPVTLNDLWKHVVSSGITCEEAQVYASANQLCTKQKIARGPEKNTYCRLDYPGARLSNSRTSEPRQEAQAITFKKIYSTPKTDPNPFHEEVEKAKKPKTKKGPIGRFDLEEVTEDLLALGLEQIKQHKWDRSLGFPILAVRDNDYCQDANYMMERTTKTFGKKPTRFAVWMVGPTPYVGLYE